MVALFLYAVGMKADLHCHSTYSDGSYTPSQIALLAKEKGFDVAVVTDHDTARGCLELKNAARSNNLEFFSGIEISSLYENKSVHLLGYSFRLDSSSLLSFEKRVLEARRRRAHSMLIKLQKLGFSIDQDALLPFEKEGVSLGRPHLARLMVEKKYVLSMQEAFVRYLGEGKSAYVPHERPSVEEAVQLIHESGGIAVLAHPQLYKNRKLVKRLMERYSIDGIEAFYCRFRGEDTSYWAAYASERKLLVTGGSDFHGAGKEETEYGVSLAPPDSVEILLERMKAHGV